MLSYLRHASVGIDTALYATNADAQCAVVCTSQELPGRESLGVGSSKQHGATWVEPINNIAT